MGIDEDCPSGFNFNLYMIISIITATYNSARTVRDTFRSVLSQDCTDYEYIVIDGGSEDGTVDLIREYEPLFGGRMKWISEPDRGIYDAMNKGIRMATGEVVGILNSDDFYTSGDILSSVVSAFSDDDGLDAVYGDIHFVDDSDLEKCVRYYSSRPFHRRWMRFGFMPAHPSFYCRRSVYEQYGTFDLSYKVAADFECLLRLLFIHRIRTRYLPLDFVTMRTGGASTSGMASHRRIMRDHQLAFKKNGVYSNVLFECLRYVYKIGEIIEYRIKNKINGTKG